MGHHVNIYDKKGRLLKKLGERKGKGPGEFTNPYGVAVDDQGYLYVNDQGNSRIQIFNPSLNFLKAISVHGQIETIVVRGSGKEATILAVGVAPLPCKESEGRCLVQKYDFGGRLIRTFARYDEPMVVYSWAVAQDNQGCTYIANRLQSEIRVFDPTGRLLRTLRLSSPSILPLKTKLNPEPKTMAELRAQVKILNTERHTEVYRIFVKNNFIFVLHVLKGEGQLSLFILDIFDLKGNLRFYGIEMPGELICVTDKFYALTEHSESEYGEK